MIYGVILAGGVGKRMGLDIPKQYLELNGKPIIIYTIESMLKCERINQIYIAVAKDWVNEVDAMIHRYLPAHAVNKIFLAEGGSERIDTIMNATNKIIENNNVNDDDIVIFHDAVRPFVPLEVLNDSIDGALKHRAVVAGVKSVDTMLYSEGGKVVDKILNREYIYKGQAPDTFNLKYFLELSERLTEEQKKNLTGTSQFCSFNNEPIYITEGSEINFKITTIEDLDKAKMFIKEGDLNEDIKPKRNK